MGGMIDAIERGFPQTEIANASYEFQRSVEQGESVIVGVNKFTEEDSKPIELLQIDASAEKKQVDRLREVKARRNAADVERTLSALKRAAEGTENTMPYILDAVRAYATVGEMCAALRDVFGRTPKPAFYSSPARREIKNLEYYFSFIRPL
jgi:methylmalonyl-CoA mutase N-terminal domain/subunit